MALSIHTEPVRIPDTEALPSSAFSVSVRVAGTAVRRFADAFSESCRRIRVYNELANLTPQALQAIGRHRDDLDRVIAGEAPRSGRRNQVPVP